MRHQLAHFLGHEEHVMEDVLGRAGEAPAQLAILRGDADGAGVEVADAHHDAARRDQRSSREAELLGPEQRAHDDVESGAQPAVDLEADAAAQVVADEHLLGLREAQLPGHAGVGEAPVPPSMPAITMWSAPALATPAATVPTPASATSLTLISAVGLAQRRSWISCARSSI